MMDVVVRKIKMSFLSSEENKPLTFAQWKLGRPARSIAGAFFANRIWKPSNIKAINIYFDEFSISVKRKYKELLEMIDRAKVSINLDLYTEENPYVCQALVLTVDGQGKWTLDLLQYPAHHPNASYILEDLTGYEFHRVVDGDLPINFWFSEIKQNGEVETIAILSAIDSVDDLEINSKLFKAHQRRTATPKQP